MCKDSDCPFQKAAKLAAEFSRLGIYSTKLALEAQLRACGFDIPQFSHLYQLEPCASMVSRLAALEAFVGVYGRVHLPHCRLNGEIGPGMSCTCGLNKALGNLGL